MKRPLQLPLAIALALGGTNAFALGLGTIHVNSKLNQPLDADIPVIQGTQGEAEGLLVQLAAAEDFDRVGLSRSRLSVPLEFSVVKGSRGDLVIKVTSKDIVREPFLDFLIEANWPKGRLLREYTVLLDPPVMAPATGKAVTSAAKTPERTTSQPLPETKPKTTAPKAAPVAAAPRPEAATPSPKAAPAAPKREIAGNEYRVEAGDTVIMTTHILDVAERMAQRIGVLTNGRLIAEGTLAELRLRSGRGGTLEDIFLTLVSETAA